MKRLWIYCLLLTALATTTHGQYPYEDVSSPDTAVIEFPFPIPTVRINSDAVAFQKSLYPEFYRAHSVRRDMRWVEANDSALVDFWQRKGDSILFVMSQLSGLDWIESRFDLYLLRYYPSFGGSDPLVIPVGGKRRGNLAIAAPEGAVQKLNLIYQLSHRMLAQAAKSDDPFYRSMTSHPLMQPTPYRRDNIAMLLALVTAQRTIGLDSTFDAYQSEFWKQQTPGRTIFEQYLLSEWILTEDRPLVQWVIEEPNSSRLVVATRTPRRSRDPADQRPRAYVKGLPLEGQLGFSVRIGDNNRLIIDQIDPNRLAYASGLREGDEIRSIDAKRFRTQKQMIEYMLEGLEAGGATVSLTRNGENLSVVLQPMELFLDADDFYYYYDSPPDSGFIPEWPVDTTGSDNLAPRPD